MLESHKWMLWQTVKHQDKMLENVYVGLHCLHILLKTIFIDRNAIILFGKYTIDCHILTLTL